LNLFFLSKSLASSPGRASIGTGCAPRTDETTASERVVNRTGVAKAAGRPATEAEPPFGAADELEWVRRVVEKTERHALSLSIVGANIAHLGGAWRVVVDALEQKWMDRGFAHPRGGLAPSVRATLDMSLDLLPNQVSREAFKACGVLPTNAKVVVCALARLWRPQLSGAASDGEPPADGAGGAACVVTRDPVAQLIDTLVRAGLLRWEVNEETGDVASVTVHPVVGEYAAALLGSDGLIDTHRRLVRDYLCGLGAIAVDGATRSYPIWKCADDGYWYDNVARHVAETRDVWGLPWLLGRSGSSSVCGPARCRRTRTMLRRCSQHF